eukprot:1847335-Amphidinium_carterae.1
MVTHPIGRSQELIEWVGPLASLDSNLWRLQAPRTSSAHVTSNFFKHNRRANYISPSTSRRMSFPAYFFDVALC